MLKHLMNSITRLAISIGTLATTGVLAAATITVTTSQDAPVGTLGSECTLRAAIASANDGTAHDGCSADSANADDIVFAASLAGQTLTLTEGQLAIVSELTITGPEPGNAAAFVIDADGNSRIFHVEIPSGSFEVFEAGLSSLTLTGGSTSGTGERGGAIAAVDTDLVLEYVHVIGNTTTASGQNAQGGGISNNGGALTLHHSTVAGNSTSGGAKGGGISITLGELTMIASNVSDNTASGNFSIGGGISLFRSDALIVDSKISGNTVQGERTEGGGIGGWPGSAELTIIDTTISGNTADGALTKGGGLFLSSSSFGDTHATVINSTLSGNAATDPDTDGGGGIWVDEDATLTLIHATIANNIAENGTAGIHLEPDAGAVVMNNSLLVQADAGESGCSEQLATSNSLATDASCTGTATPAADIALDALQDNGGPTPTHALGASSVAIDAAGDCEADFGLTADQRGRSRPGILDRPCDIGAFEFQDTVFHDRFDQHR